MSDISNLFKATVKTVKSRHKALGTGGDNDKSSILSHSRQKGDFEAKAKGVVKIITKLRDYILQHRKEYVNAGSHLTIEMSQMSDAERDQIDTDSQKVIKSCQETIKTVRQDAHNMKVNPQIRDHRDGVLYQIEAYLKYVCKLYSEQRAVRVKRVVDRKRISRLEPDRKIAKRQPVEPVAEKMDVDKGSDMEVRTKSLTGSPGDGDRVRNSRQVLSGTISGVPEDGGRTSEAEEDEISTEEAQLFEQENKAIYDELNSMMNEVRQIEGRVVEISRLQEILSEKVLEQDKDVDRIADTVVGTTENIVEGNEQIREALKKNAGFRVWILFFLVVCSLSLLFLDWYN